MEKVAVNFSHTCSSSQRFTMSLAGQLWWNLLSASKQDSCWPGFVAFKSGNSSRSQILSTPLSYCTNQSFSSQSANLYTKKNLLVTMSLSSCQTSEPQNFCFNWTSGFSLFHSDISGMDPMQYNLCPCGTRYFNENLTWYVLLSLCLSGISYFCWA